MDITSLDKSLIAEAWTSPDLYANLETLCDFGSRFAGTPGEIQARDFIAEKFRTYGLAEVRLDPFEYLGWWRGSCVLSVVSPVERALEAISLVYSPSTLPGRFALRAPIVDVGMGTEKEYARKQGMLGAGLCCVPAPIPKKAKRLTAAKNMAAP